MAWEKQEDKPAHARRVKGFDDLGKLCYHHAYAISRERFDEEGLYDESEAYRQEITAWRLYTGGWLVRKYEGGAHSDCSYRLVKPSYPKPDKPEPNRVSRGDAESAEENNAGAGLYSPCSPRLRVRKSCHVLTSLDW